MALRSRPRFRRSSARSPVPETVALTVVASTIGIVGGMSAAAPPDESPQAVHIAATANTSPRVCRLRATPTLPSVTVMQLRRGLIALVSGRDRIGSTRLGHWRRCHSGINGRVARVLGSLLA